jgi:peptide/nickel transport system substrate-binding protein
VRNNWLGQSSISLGIMALVLLTAPAHAQQTPKKGGTAVVAIGVDPTGINPVINTSDAEKTVGCMIYEGLTAVNAKTDRPDPVLAQSWTISPDGKTYTFKLRKANWQDGKPFSSEDVRFTYMEVAAKYGPTFANGAGKVLEAIETPDPQTAVFKLKEPYGPLLRVLSCAANGPVIPSHLFKDSDPIKNPANQKPVGTGSFKLSEWIRTDRLTLVRNDQYWDQPKPFIDRIVVKVMPAAPSRIQSLLTGEIDFIQSTYVPASDRKTIASNGSTKLELSSMPPNALHGFFNVRKEPFNDVRVRQALLIATDRKYLHEKIFYGVGRIGNSPWTTQIEWAHDSAISYDKTYPLNPDMAAKLLDEAGLKPDASGIRLKMNILYDASSYERQQVALALKSMWRKAGVDVTPIPLETAVLYPRVYDEWNFDFFLVEYTSLGDLAMGVARSYVTASIKGRFGNAAGYSNPDVDALFAKGGTLSSQEERGAVYKQIEPILMRDVPAIILHEDRGIDAASKRLRDAWTYAGQGFWPTAWLDE